MKTGIISGLFIVIAGLCTFSFKQEKEAPEKTITQLLITQTDDFSRLVGQSQKALESGKTNEKQLQQLFLQTRLSYKKFEWAAEYFTPNITRFVNGPPVPEVEMGGSLVLEPEGLQVIEGFLFPRYDVSKKKVLLQQLKLLQSNCAKYRIYFKHIDISNWQIFDAAKLEVFRILTLGITGFDNPLTLKSMKETEVSLQQLQTVLAEFPNPDNLPETLTAARGYLLKNTGFNTFDRAVFITRYGNEITRAITLRQKQLHLPVVKYNRLLNQDAATLFDENAFDVNAYAPAPEYFVTDQKVALGKKLFSDPVLSGNQSRSCASCHRPEQAFTDGLVKNTAIGGKGLLRRNTPTLLNAALQPFQFYDLRAITLEDQGMDVIQNKDEMHGSMKVAVEKLWQDKTYRALFAAAFPKNDRTTIDTLEITNALSSFIRSLTRLNSRFDEYMRGSNTAMNRQELNGFNLFMGKAKCATCHYMPLFNGTVPPKYIRLETEVIGVPKSPSGKKIDPDRGAYDIINISSLQHSFKTTTVRNAARTAPYMHNGVFKTLEEVIDFYNKGGGTGRGIKIDNQTLSADQLKLTKKETAELVAFIKSLDSKSTGF